MEEIQPGFENWVNAWSLGDCRVPFWGYSWFAEAPGAIRKVEHFGNRAPWAEVLRMFWPPSIGAGLGN